MSNATRFFKIRHKKDGLFWTSNFSPMATTGKEYANRRSVAKGFTSIKRFQQDAYNRFELVQFEASEVSVEDFK